MAEEPTPEAWDPIHDEEVRSGAYAAFQYYRELGYGRSMVAVARAFRVSSATVHRWSRDWFWVDRIADFEKAQVAERDARYAELRAQGAERWAKQQAIMQDLAAEVTITELTGIRKRQIDAGGAVMTPAEFARLFREVNHQGNLASGRPTEILTQQVDLAKLSETDRAALSDPVVRAALEKIAKG